MKKRKDIFLANDLTRIFSACGVDSAALADKRHVCYLAGYLTRLGAKSAVVEYDYIDRDFLEDYVQYYSRCFAECGRNCCRVHFFKKEYTNDTFLSAELGRDGNAELVDSYLGFIVIRPLSRTFIGRTCLIPYTDDSSRHFSAICHVDVSLFGQRLSIDCMPFQEQDRAVAACATCALWSAFHVSSCKFGHACLTPGKITEIATQHGISASRSFPNAGLSLRDVAYAIRGAGLVPVCVGIESADKILRPSMILGNVRAYLGIGIPLIALGVVFDADGKKRSCHALAINGYHLSDSGDVGTDGLCAKRIDKLYLHDDQLGPYARATLGASSADAEMNVSWTDAEGRRNGYDFGIQYLVIPMYHKIRVDYEQVWRCAFALQRVASSASHIIGSLSFEWDIMLCASNDFKDAVREDAKLSDADKITYLELGYPRYIWNVRVKLNGRDGAVFCIDATDASQGLSVVASIFYQNELPLIVAMMAKIAESFHRNPLCQACVAAVNGSSGFENLEVGHVEG